VNERVTEQIVRSHLDRSAEEVEGVRYWEQTPDNVRIGKLLARASKSGAGMGRPEFIVSFDDYQDFLIVMECKANLAKHESADGKSNPKDFAVDGVRHYAKHLSREFNVLAIAVSGTQKSNLRVNHFLRFKGDGEDENADNLLGKRLRKLSVYIDFYRDHDKLLNQNLNELLLFTKELNQQLHGLKIKEADRSLLISAILTALEEDGFLNSYRKINKPTLLLTNIKNAMLESMNTSGIQAPTIQSVKSSYSFMDIPGKLGQGRVLADLVGDIDERVNNFKKTHEYYDFLGQFYIEFLRYSNSGKGLGIVLTPPHITDLAARLAKVGASDTLYDNCAGTGGFLISGMKEMIRDAQGDARRIKRIKAKGIVGVEIQPDIATLLYSNMFIHGDGKSNVFKGDCFDSSMSRQIKAKYKPTVGFLNPPFKAAPSDSEEIDFVLNNMATLQAGGRCVALLPMQCALSQKGVRQSMKQKILDEHTLEAVLSLPGDIFHNSKVGVVTCLMVFTAGRPHPKGKKTWFGYCKDDGFVKRKPQGRIDYYNKWQTIRDNWLGSFHNRTVRPGFSVMMEVSARDEWCAEAFIETDYAKLTELDFAEALKKFAAYRFISEEKIPERNPKLRKSISLPHMRSWKEFSLSDLFSIKGTKTTKLEDLIGYGTGKHPYITTQAVNNGVAGFYDFFTEEGGVITVDSAVLGFASYQRDNFSASDHVEKLIPKFSMNSYLAMFFVVILNADQFRYNYGRKASQDRMRQRKIKLPAKPGGDPDFELMARFIKSLPFSSNLPG